MREDLQMMQHIVETEEEYHFYSLFPRISW